MAKFIDLTGQTFGKLKIIKRAENNKNNSVRWLCKCSCGSEVIVNSKSLRNLIRTDCGCERLKKITKHGLSKEPLYKVWKQIKRRCENPSDPSYKDYGGRGIKLCPRWQDVKNFIEDMGDRPTPKHTVERIKNDKDYSPDNCVWATRKEQARNRRMKCKGVQQQRSGRYIARLYINGKNHNGPARDTLEEAIEDRKQLEQEHWSVNQQEEIK